MANIYSHTAAVWVPQPPQESPGLYSPPQSSRTPQRSLVLQDLAHTYPSCESIMAVATGKTRGSLRHSSDDIFQCVSLTGAWNTHTSCWSLGQEEPSRLAASPCRKLEQKIHKNMVVSELFLTTQLHKMFSFCLSAPAWLAGVVRDLGLWSGTWDWSGT